jgi:hypothetical protein
LGKDHCISDPQFAPTNPGDIHLIIRAIVKLDEISGTGLQ